MKRLLSLFLTVAVASTSFSQEKVAAVSGGVGRTAALGGGPYNLYIQDYTDVFINPAYAAQYQSFLFGDIGYGITAYNASGQYVGYTMGLGDLSIGLAVGKREGPMFPENAYGAGTYGSSDYMKPAIDSWGFLPGAFGATLNPLAPIQLYGAVKFSGLSVGAAIYRSSWSREESKTAAAGGISRRAFTRNSQTGFKVGVLMDFSSSMKLDASFLLRLNGSRGEWSDTGAATPNSATYDVSGTEIGVTARMFLKMSDRVDLVPVVRFYTFGYKPEITDNTSPVPALVNSNPNDYGRTDLELGIGLQNTFDNGFVTAGLSFQQIRLKNDITAPLSGSLQTTKNTQVQTDLPKFNFGAEINLLDWLVGRFGYFKRFTTTDSKTEPPTTATTESTTSSEAGYVPNLGYTAAQQQVSLGLGIKVSRLALDGYVGERFLAAGPFILSGNVQDLFGVLSLSFRF